MPSRLDDLASVLADADLDAFDRLAFVDVVIDHHDFPEPPVGFGIAFSMRCTSATTCEQ